jgi:hypothetical protein
MLKVRKDSAYYFDCQLLAFQWLTVGDLPELFHYIGITVGHVIGEQIVNADAKSVDEPHECIQCKAPFPSLDSPHVGIGYVNCFGKRGLRKV